MVSKRESNKVDDPAQENGLPEKAEEAKLRLPKGVRPHTATLHDDEYGSLRRVFLLADLPAIMEAVEQHFIERLTTRLESDEALEAAVAAFSESKAEPGWEWDTPGHVCDALQAAISAAASTLGRGEDAALKDSAA